MDRIKQILNDISVKRAIAFLILIVTIFLIRDMLNLLILTFIIGFILFNVQKVVKNGTSRFIELPDKLVQVFVYTLTLAGLIYLISSYIPIIVTQLTDIFTMITAFSPSELSGAIHPSLYEMLRNLDINKYITNFGSLVLDNVKVIWSITFEVCMAFLLSFLFLWERDKVALFMKRFEDSKVSFFYSYYVEIGRRFINSFGKMIQLQIIISSVNTCLSAVMLMFMGFPNIIGLSFLVFVLGLIPVAGVIISLVPLSVIAFQIGGISKVIAVLIMIVIIHAIESYILNPKLTSAKMHLPVFFTFFILLFGEHYLGVWGLLIGLPLVIFALDLVDAKPVKEEKELEKKV